MLYWRMKQKSGSRRLYLSFSTLIDNFFACSRSHSFSRSLSFILTTLILIRAYFSICRGDIKFVYNLLDQVFRESKNGRKIISLFLSMKIIYVGPSIELQCYTVFCHVNACTMFFFFFGALKFLYFQNHQLRLK